jgi:hypothetical protein
LPEFTGGLDGGFGTVLFQILVSLNFCADKVLFDAARRVNEQDQSKKLVPIDQDRLA